jgi:DNA-binding response OmpR family regulator
MISFHILNRVDTDSGVCIMSKILVVDDNFHIRQLLHMFFTDAGFAVFDAGDGKEGFTIAKAEKPDLIITDLHMPRGNGTELIKQLRGEPEMADTPVLLFTGEQSFNSQDAGEVGAHQTFYKPHGFYELVQTVCAMFPH